METISSATGVLVRLVALSAIGYQAYEIRLHAVKTFGYVIHEFDPWFNYRATEYLVDNGPKAFMNWFDEESWYPLGRPVGTTIYPGMQFISAFIFWTGEALGTGWALNDICVLIPAMFAVITCMFTYLLGKEVSGSCWAGVVAAYIMSIIPAHLMRSVAGGYDNESVAVAAMVSTFFLWVRSLRNNHSWKWGVLTGVAYFNMAAAWGGYTFVLNMIGVHAGLMFLCGMHTTNLHRAYSLFYVIGTALAIQIPVVGWQPLKSLEQLGPMGVFCGLQLAEVCNMHFTRNPTLTITEKARYGLRVFGAAGAVGVTLIAFFLPAGFLGPISARVRGLFVQHTRTGNPLVDSVAEHQATHPQAYFVYLNTACYFAPMGLAICLLKWTPGRIFMASYLVLTAYFSQKMVRLILLLAPPASIASGLVIGYLIDWTIAALPEPIGAPTPVPTVETKKSKATSSKSQNAKKDKTREIELEKSYNLPMRDQLKIIDDSIPKRIKQLLGALLLSFVAYEINTNFAPHCRDMAKRLSNPSIMLQYTTRDGEPRIIDDFREAYWWLRDETPQDSRVLSWWDYGYQIAGIANRTTIADGNTWNHEHIALLGRSLVKPVEEGHEIMRHLADYVLVWSTQYGGMHGDDVAKSPHMARISGSVYSDINHQIFGMMAEKKPTAMMAASVVYNLVHYRLNPEVQSLPPNTFKEVFTSKHNMVRIYKVERVSKESKNYCSEGRGKKMWLEGKPSDRSIYPPAIQEIMKNSIDFAQLEDFNRNREAKSKTRTQKRKSRKRTGKK